jgi:hypothetical protein
MFYDDEEYHDPGMGMYGNRYGQPTGMNGMPPPPPNPM